MFLPGSKKGARRRFQSGKRSRDERIPYPSEALSKRTGFVDSDPPENATDQRVVGGSLSRRPAGRVGSVLAARRSAASFGRDCGHPGRRPASSGTAAPGQSFESHNRLFNSLAFLPQLR